MQNARSTDGEVVAGRGSLQREGKEREDFTVADLTSCQRQKDPWPANLSYFLGLSQKGAWTLTEGCQKSFGDELKFGVYRAM